MNYMKKWLNLCHLIQGPILEGFFMAKREYIISIDMDPDLTLDELCQICQISADYVLELVAYGAIEPKNPYEEAWVFTTQQLRRIRTILHLQEDLEVNLPGAILALELMQKIGDLQTELDMFKKYLEYK